MREYQRICEACLFIFKLPHEGNVQISQELQFRGVRMTAGTLQTCRIPRGTRSKFRFPARQFGVLIWGGTQEVHIRGSLSDSDTESLGNLTLRDIRAVFS